MKLIFDTQWKTLEIEEIKDLRIEDNQLQLLVAWVGLEDFEDSWEPLDSTYASVPNTVENFVRNMVKQKREDASIALNLIAELNNPKVRIMQIQTKVTTQLLAETQSERPGRN